MGIIGVLVIVVGLLISVALHECGHMIPAKKFGVYVPEFAVGFGPQIFGVKKGETTYSLRAILLGGYVRLVGMFAPARDGVKTTNRRGKPTLAQEAREASMEEIPEGYGSRAFYLLHPAQKIIVMISGPLVNLFLSILFLSVALVGIGIPKASLTLSEVPQQLTTQGATVDAPAYAAGIRAGDTITGVNGSAVTSWEQMRQSIAGSQGSIDIDYLRNGQLFHVNVDPLRSGDNVSIGVIAGTEYQSASVGTVASTVGETFTGTVSVVARLPIALWDVGRSIFTGAPRDSGGVMSVVGIGRIAADATSSDVTASSGGWMRSAALLLSILASLNMALFVFNLLPFPPLDGGHIVPAIYEWIRRGFARVRGREVPPPVDTARLMPLTYTMGTILVAMTVLLMIADIVVPISLQ
ncbi:Zinc metalloprotease Rip1 [Schaalia odontolytica]|uniref:Zinc metalloprotease Rip1 n=1 Tax=Schaalia odontolytica TaxID=1660 RepID=A0A6N2U3H8_9ACTO